eukprot:COSAG03_NODE_137_length_11785_cov_19.757827_11_plen_117_part_00
MNILWLCQQAGAYHCYGGRHQCLCRCTISSTVTLRRTICRPVTGDAKSSDEHPGAHGVATSPCSSLPSYRPPRRATKGHASNSSQVSVPRFGAAVLSRVVLEFRVKLHEMNRVAEF